LHHRTGRLSAVSTGCVVADKGYQRSGLLNPPTQSVVSSPGPGHHSNTSGAVRRHRDSSRLQPLNRRLKNETSNAQRLILVGPEGVAVGSALKRFENAAKN
jgi:hypothetical protein